MKVKIGTTMDTDLYRKVQGSAQQRGCSISQLIEEALRAYLKQQSVGSIDRVSESFGQYRVSASALHEIMQEDPFET